MTTCSKHADDDDDDVDDADDDDDDYDDDDDAHCEHQHFPGSTLALPELHNERDLPTQIHINI